MTKEERITWIPNGMNVMEAYNDNDEHLGFLQYQFVGRHKHWCWNQFTGIYMSPSCVEEMRIKQKELWKTRGQ